MRIIAKVLSLALIVLISSSCLYDVSAVYKGGNLTVLFTHDMHDHMLPNKSDKEGVVIETGGYSRMKTAIDKSRKEHENSILVDAGDYSMGDLFQTVFTTDAQELRIMGQMGYDVTTFGNHEFDFRDSGLASHLHAAKNSGDKLPEIVSTNISFPAGSHMTKSLLNLKNAMSDYGVKEYTVLKRNGIKIGVFGLIGKEAASYCPTSEVTFGEIVKIAKNTVNKLKNKEKVDMIVCLSHSGTKENSSDSEDVQLAEKVPDIDVIISGHSHTTLSRPIIKGKTIIASCGQYGNNLGSIDFVQKPQGGWKMTDYKLIPIDSQLKEDTGINAEINRFKAIVQEKYLDSYNFKFNELLANTRLSFNSIEEMEVKHKEQPLGDLIADGYIYSVKKAEGAEYVPIEVAVVTAGTIRGSFVKGNITVEDAFITSPLGTGADGISGYPLVSAYLTGRELRDLCEVDASITPIMSSAQLYMSGISFTYNPNRLIFNRVTEMHLQKQDGTKEKIIDSKLYRVVTGLYNAQMLSIVGDKSFGILSIVPKSKEGKPIKNFEDYIIYNKSNGASKELKEWLSTAQYLKSFKKVDGIARVPEYYSKTHNRKIADDNKNIFAIMENPNSFAIKVYIASAVLILVLALITVKLVKRWRRRRTRSVSV